LTEEGPCPSVRLDGGSGAGADVGADAYSTKGAFNDDRLIEAVRNFV
jgi:hypothetical protein